MPNEIVKYHNDLNSADLRGWTKEEMNLFFAIISKLKDHTHKEEVEIKKDEILEITKYNQKSNKRLIKITAGLIGKIKRIEYIERTSRSITWMSLFTKARIEWNEEKNDFIAMFKISEDFEYILNKLDANFTKFELEEFVQLKSVYAKQAYRLLKQWKTVGRKKFDIEEFRYIFLVPESYSASDISKNVLDPIKKELPAYFPALSVRPVKSKKRGNPVAAYEFTWTPEKTLGPYEPGKPKTKRKSQKASLPEWYYQEDPGHATEAQAEELKSLLERPADPKPEADETDSNDDDIFDPFEGI